MNNTIPRKYGIQLGIMIILLILASWLAILTFVQHDTGTSGIWAFFVHNHVALMLFLVIVSIGFGFVWSMSLFREVEERKTDSEELLDVVMEFLSQEERTIIEYLVKNEGTGTQAEISRIKGMTRVKAYRSLKKMEEKKLVSIHSHGKIRSITLAPRLQKLLQEH